MSSEKLQKKKMPIKKIEKKNDILLKSEDIDILISENQSDDSLISDLKESTDNLTLNINSDLKTESPKKVKEVINFNIDENLCQDSITFLNECFEDIKDIEHVPNEIIIEFKNILGKKVLDDKYILFIESIKEYYKETLLCFQYIKRYHESKDQISSEIQKLFLNLKVILNINKDILEENGLVVNNKDFTNENKIDKIYNINNINLIKYNNLIIPRTLYLDLYGAIFKGISKVLYISWIILLINYEICSNTTTTNEKINKIKYYILNSINDALSKKTAVVIKKKTIPKSTKNNGGKELKINEAVNIPSSKADFTDTED